MKNFLKQGWLRGVVLLACGWGALAFEMRSLSAQIEFTFVPPPLEGSVSLGIFSESGALVRILNATAPPSDFPQALNGFQSKWDGLDDEGQAVPPGKYRAEGYAVGALLVSQADPLFNDWRLAAPDSRSGRMLDGALLPDGRAGWIALGDERDLYFLATASDGKVELVHRLQDVLAGENVVVVAAMGNGFVGTDGRFLFRLGVEPGRALQLDGVSGLPVQLSFEGNHGVLVTSAGVWDLAVSIGAEDGEMETVTTSSIAPVAAGDDASVLSAVRAGDRFWWVSQDGDAFWVPMSGDEAGLSPDWNAAGTLSAELGKARFLSATGDGGVRVVVEQEGQRGWVRLDAQGAVVEQSDFSPEEKGLLRIASAGEAPFLLMLSAENGMQRTRLLREKAVLFDRTVKSVANVRFVDGQPMMQSEGGVVLPPSPEFELVENPLLGEEKPKVHLSAALEGNACWLTTPEGLPLLPIGMVPGAVWAALVEGTEPGSATCYVSDGGAIHEFRISGIQDLMSFDAGEFEYPEPAAEKE